MDYLQYAGNIIKATASGIGSFKPCYKWITFNTDEALVKEFRKVAKF